MKVSEFRQLIREEVRKVLIEDQSSLPTLEDVKAKNPYLAVIAIADKFVGDKKDIIIPFKTTREKLKRNGYTPVGMCTDYNSGAYSVEFIQSQIDKVLNNKNYTVRPNDLKLWKSNPADAYKEGISYRHTGPESTRDSNLGQFGTIGGSEFRPTPLYMSTNGINITGADNGKLIGFIFSMTQKTIIAVK